VGTNTYEKTAYPHGLRRLTVNFKIKSLTTHTV
jgi:hypothetical protein